MTRSLAVAVRNASKSYEKARLSGCLSIAGCARITSCMKINNFVAARFALVLGISLTVLACTEDEVQDGEAEAEDTAEKA